MIIIKFMLTHSSQFGRQLALWHRESDEIHNK